MVTVDYSSLWVKIVYFILVLLYLIDIFISLFQETLNYEKKTQKKISDKIIHIRIDELIHQQLKMKAASSKTTIQEIVEGMLMRKFSSKK